MMRPFALLLLVASVPVAAQQPPTPTPDTPAPLPPRTSRSLVPDTSAFAPLLLPLPNEQRRPTGAPGAAYWQQQADYTIRATLDTLAKRLTGTVAIRYTNRSPDTLRSVWLQVDQNLFRPGSLGSLLNPPDSRSAGHGFVGGYTIDRVTQTAPVPAKTRTPPASTEKRPTGKAPGPGGAAPLRSRIQDTMMFVELATPLAPGGTTVLSVDYWFDIPPYGADRMGRDGSLYLLGQWYPRMAVYDDVRGWNILPYTGDGEFYLEFGDFDYEITVPAGYLVAGTGLVQNPEEVYTPAERSRLAAAKGDTVVHIVAPEDLAPGAARASRRSTTTWKLRAEKVRDVAWAAAPDYLWDATTWNGTTCHAVYRPAAALIWSDAAAMTCFAIKEYSTRWFPYPYPQATAAEGHVSGMEYPMMALEAKGDRPEDLFAVIAHEVGHNWFPMIVGSDERRYAWMDEGFDEFMNRFAEAEYLGLDRSDLIRQYAKEVMAIDQLPGAQPMMTDANRYRSLYNLNNLAYHKPMLGLFLLREKILGPEVFDTAFKTYIRRWAFKHPQPADFFRTVEEVAGKDLTWFWRGWFFDTGGLDQAIEAVRQRSNPDGTVTALIVLRNLGGLVMPVELKLTLTDDSTRLLGYPAEIWARGDRYQILLSLPRPIQNAQLNPDGLLPDLVPANDTWKAP